MVKSAWLALLLFVLPLAATAGPGTSDTVVERIRPRGAVQPARPVADPAALCETAATSAEYSERLPPRLLQAIGLTETGRLDPSTGRVRPWPWTIDVEGQGQFFATRDDAVAAVKSFQAHGIKSIDVGCNQVNLMFHPDAFATLEEAFDPTANARFAARFLNALNAGSHDWSHAIAAYHSETPALGDAYRVLVLTRWQNPDLHPQVEQESAYQAFAPTSQVYGAFQPTDRVYGAFSQGR
ncbi:MAG TPA: hypothetical protein VFG62_23635 [Rhodopila sp.]|nr:hypothetical protein [Rhodopila sp.]